MSDIRRWEDDYFRYEGDQMTEDPEGRFVLYTDHAEAVAALTSFAVKQIMGEEEDTRRDLLASYEQGKVDERKRSVLLIADAYKQGREQGQRDALAACLAAVEHDDSCWALRDGDVLDERDCNCYYSLIIERLRTVVTSTGAPTDPLLYRIDYDNASVRASVPIVDFNTTGTEVEHVDTCRVYNCGGCEEIKGDSDE